MTQVIVQQVIRKVVVLANQQGLPGTAGPVGLSADTLEKTVTVPVGGHRAVAVIGGLLVYFDNTNPAHFGRVLGLTLNAASSGDKVTIKRSGEITEPSWNFPSENVIYFGPNGLLTSVAPTTGFLQVAGFTTASNKVFFDPQPAIKILE